MIGVSKGLFLLCRDITRVYPVLAPVFTNQESSMFTAAMCLALVGVVAVSGVVYSKKMDELLSDPSLPATETPRV